MNTIITQFKECAEIPRAYALAFTILLTIAAMILFAVIAVITQNGLPVLLLSFAVFLGSSFTWVISAWVKKVG